VIEVSEAGKRLLAEIVQDRMNGPQALYDAWAAGQISDRDLPALIPDTWLYVDWPERIIGVGKWVRLFRAAGFLSIPYGLSRPDSAITVFRGATAERRTGMSWTTDVDRADQFRQRHSWHAPTAIYRAVVMPDAVLALLERRGEARQRSWWTRRCSLLWNRSVHFICGVSAETSNFGPLPQGLRKYSARRANSLVPYRISLAVLR
jgi:hypothetical protein